MRAIVGREGLARPAALGSEMGRFETEWLAADANLQALGDLSGAWIVRHGRYVVLQLAEVAVPRSLFAAILRRIDRLRGPPVPAT